MLTSSTLIFTQIYRSRDLANAGNNKLRNQVAQELQTTIERIADINMQLDYYKQRAFDPPSFGMSTVGLPINDLYWRKGLHKVL